MTEWSLRKVIDQLTDNQDLKNVLMHCWGDYGIIATRPATRGGQPGNCPPEIMFNKLQSFCLPPKISPGCVPDWYHYLTVERSFAERFRKIKVKLKL